MDEELLPDQSLDVEMMELEIVEPPVSEKLRYGSELHGEMITKLRTIIYDAEKYIRQRYDDWDKVDQHNRLYIDLEAEARRADKSYIPGKKEYPYQRSIAIPLTYHIIMTRLATLHSMLTAPDPFVHLESLDSDGWIKARLMEARLGHDARNTNNDIQVWQMIYDNERYGLCGWKLGFEEGYETQPAAQHFGDPVLAFLNGYGPEDPIDKIAWQGNRWKAVDPRHMILDPAVPSGESKQGEYIGDWEYPSWLELDKRRMDRNDGPYFNVDDARKLGRTNYRRRNSDGRWQDGDFQYKSKDTHPTLEKATIQWRLIPSEHGLGPGQDQEIWHFEVVNEQIIVRAHKLEQGDGGFTYFFGQGDLDMHAPFVPGMGSQLIGFQLTENWLVNSHITNARKAVNDQIVYNDDLISRVDLSNPSAMRHVRLTREGKKAHLRGMRIQDMYGQLAITDITGQHIETVKHMTQEAQRMAATPDTMQGMPMPTKRTLGEIDTVNQSATLRIGITGQLLDTQVIGPCMMAAVRNLQKYVQLEEYVLTSGRLIEQLASQGVMIKPQMLQGNFAYVVRTPTMAKDPARSGAVWGQIMQVLSTAPQLLSPMPDGRAINPHAILNELIRNLGVDYFEQFYFQTQPTPMMPVGGPAQVRPDEAIQQGVQAGNLVPAGG